MSNRRAFLKLIAASPLFATVPSIAKALAEQPASAVIDKVAAALDVFDFEAAARTSVPPAHWGYLATGVDGEDTLRDELRLAMVGCGARSLKEIGPASIIDAGRRA